MSGSGCIATHAFAEGEVIKVYYGPLIYQTMAVRPIARDIYGEDV